MRYAAVLTLCLFAFIFPSVTEAGTGFKHFVKYTSALSWNQAREICQQNGMELAVLNKFATAFIQHIFSLQPQYNTDNIWISLRDAAQIEGSVGAAGLMWYKCRSYFWTNWAPGEPANRWNNWCVRLLYQQGLKWQLQQCLSQAHFLCQKARGLCDKFVNADEAGCNITSSNLKAVMNDSLSDYNCSVACIEHSSYHARCWVYTYSAQDGCVLHVGLTPVYCNRSSEGTGGQGGTNGSSVRWVKECYTFSYNHSTDLDVSNYTSPYALDGCENFEITTSVTDPTTESMSSSLPTSLSPSATTEESTSPSSPKAPTQQTASSSTTTTTQKITSSPPSPQATTEQITSLSSLASSSPAMTQQITSSSTTIATQKITSSPPSPQATTEQITSLSSVASSSPATTQQTASPSVPVTTTSGRLSNGTSLQAVYDTSMPETQTSTSTSTPPPSSLPPPKTTTTTTIRKPCCRCSFRQRNVNASKATEAAQELRRELMLDKTRLSATRRQKESAMDSRPSVLATGGVGVAILVGVMCLIVVPDLLTLCRIINHS